VFTRVEVLPDPPAVRWWGQQWHRVHLAVHFETRYRHAGYYRSIRERIRELCIHERIDLIHVDLLAMIQYVDPQTNIPAIVDLHDSMTLLRRRMLNAERGWRKRLSAYLGLISAKRLEGTLGRTFDLVITNSTVDEQVIRELSPKPKTLTITNGVDMDYFAPTSALLESDKLVFTGVMGYAPNEDAALHFVEDIFPLVRAKRPEVQFWIVGSGPSERVKALTRISGVHVTGKVDDVRPYVRSATVFVCPLRIGSGVKNKILAAMAMQKATVYSERLGAISDEQFHAVAERLRIGRFVLAAPTTSGLFGQNVFVTTTEGEFVLRGAPHWVRAMHETQWRQEDRWQGVTAVSDKKLNPSWTPTPTMMAENPRLPRWVPGGHPMNPLGVRALYLGDSFYRIHGTDAPWTIGTAISKGCIRMYNEDVLDLYPRASVGGKVTVTWQRFNTAS
jgi:glycosyltransferase involved in cell wall biosynthesis